MTRTHLGRRHWLVALFLALSLMAAACGDDDKTNTAATEETEDTEAESTTTTAEEEKEQLDVTMGGSSSSSSVFAYLTTQARLADDIDGAMTTNIRETGASTENIQLLEDGAVDFGLSGLSTVIQANRGLGGFAGNPIEDICLLMTYLKNGEFITVRADAGIDTIEDLDGQPFAPSFQGSAVYDNMLAYFEVLGIEVEVFDGGLEDIVNAMKDGRIVGFGKSANGLGPDASMLDVASTVPVKALGFSQEQVDQILAAAPENRLLYQFTEVAPGSIYDNPEPLLSPVVIAVYFANSESLTEEEQYRVTKAYFEATPEAATQANYAGAQGITAQDTLDQAEKLELCPGAQRYFDEVG